MYSMYGADQSHSCYFKVIDNQCEIITTFYVCRSFLDKAVFNVGYAKFL